MTFIPPQALPSLAIPLSLLRCDDDDDDDVICLAAISAFLLQIGL